MQKGTVGVKNCPPKQTKRCEDVVNNYYSTSSVPTAESSAGCAVDVVVVVVQ